MMDGIQNLQCRRISAQSEVNTGRKYGELKSKNRANMYKWQQSMRKEERVKEKQSQCWWWWHYLDGSLLWNVTDSVWVGVVWRCRLYFYMRCWPVCSAEFQRRSWSAYLHVCRLKLLGRIERRPYYELELATIWNSNWKWNADVDEWYCKKGPVFGFERAVDQWYNLQDAWRCRLSKRWIFCSQLLGLWWNGPMPKSVAILWAGSQDGFGAWVVVEIEG